MPPRANPPHNLRVHAAPLLILLAAAWLVLLAATGLNAGSGAAAKPKRPPSTTPPPPPPPPPGPSYAVRGVYDRDLSVTGFDDEAALGFNFIDSSPNRDQMDALAARGLKGFLWLGGYSNTTCSFNQTDDWVR